LNLRNTLEKGFSHPTIPLKLGGEGAGGEDKGEGENPILEGSPLFMQSLII
jgi:hypothetical protein